MKPIDMPQIRLMRVSAAKLKAINALQRIEERILEREEMLKDMPQGIDQDILVQAIEMDNEWMEEAWTLIVQGDELN